MTRIGMVDGLEVFQCPLVHGTAVERVVEAFSCPNLLGDVASSSQFVVLARTRSYRPPSTRRSIPWLWHVSRSRAAGWDVFEHT